MPFLWWAMFASRDQRLVFFNQGLHDSALATNQAALLRDPKFTVCVSSFSIWPESTGQTPSGCFPCVYVNQRMCGALFWLSRTPTGVKVMHLFAAPAYLWSVVQHGCLLNSFWEALLGITSNSFPEMSFLSQYTDLLGYHVLYPIEIYHEVMGPNMIADLYCGISFSHF